MWVQRTFEFFSILIINWNIFIDASQISNFYCDVFSQRTVLWKIENNGPCHAFSPCAELTLMSIGAPFTNQGLYMTHRVTGRSFPYRTTKLMKHCNPF